MSPNDAKGWFELIALIGLSGWFILIAVIYIFVKHTEKLFLWLEKFARAFSWCSTKMSKATISNQVRGNILKASKKISKENEGILPYDLKIEWVSEEKKDAFIKNKQVIVRMSQQNNPNKNLVLALNEYVKKGLIPKTRKYLDPKLLSATDLTFMRKLLGITELEEAIDYFDDNILSPAVEDEETKELIESLYAIDNNGMFVTILLNEFIKATRTVFPNPPDPCLVAESRELLRFLHSIATKKPGETVPTLEFNREYFKIAVPLAKSDSTHTNYILNEVFNDLNKGIDTIYIMGLGRKAHVAKDIAQVARERDIRIRDIKVHGYLHKSSRGKTNGICVEVRTYKNSEEKLIEIS